MAHTVESRIDTPTTELREQLDRAERQLPTLTSSELPDYLRILDRVELLLETLIADAVDLRPEMTRWLGLQARLGSQAGRLVKLARPSGGFAALRAANPPATGSWWNLDRLVAADRKRGGTRLLMTLVVVAGALALAAFVYQQWLAPSPEVVLTVGALNNVEQMVMEQKWDEAYAVVEQTLQKAPDNSDLLIWGGVLSEQRGAAAQAAGYLERAQQVIGDPLRYQLALGMHRLQAGDAAGAENAANAARAIDPQEPQAVFLLANVAELRGQTQQALDLYQQTSDLAEADNPQLTVVSKMRYGMLLQQMNFTLDTPVATGEPAGTPASAATTTPSP